MKTKISPLTAVLIAFAFALLFLVVGCVKFGVIPSQAISATCHTVDAGEKSVLLAHANHQLNDAWIPPIKACVIASESVCVDPMPTNVAPALYDKLTTCVDAVTAARVPGSVPSAKVLQLLKPPK